MSRNMLQNTATSGRASACAGTIASHVFENEGLVPSANAYQPTNWHGKRGADLATSPGRSHALI